MNLEPSEAQKSAGNYAKRHDKFQGLDLSIETPKGAERTGIGKNGEPWSVKMPHDYGYIKRTEGADGDQVDVYVGHHKKSPHVFIVDQHDADSGEFDEHKVMLGFANAQQAASAYDRGFSDGSGPKRRRALLHMGMEDFKGWLAAGNAKKSVKGFASGGRVKKASGGWVFGGPQQEEPEVEVPQKAPKQEDGWVLGTLKDMGREAAKGFMDTRQTIREGIGQEAIKRRNDRENDPNASWMERNVTGPIADTAKAGAAALSIPNLALAPVVGAAKSLYSNIETPIAEAVIGRLPQKEGYEFPREQWRESAKEGFETAINALGARGAHIPAPTGPRVAPMPAEIGDFNVPLTRGEAARDLPQIAQERQALRGQMSGRAQQEAEARIGATPDSERMVRLQEARDDIARGFDSQGQIIADTPETGGNLLQQAVQDARRNAKAGVDQTYTDLRAVPGEFNPEIFQMPLGERVSAYAFPDGGGFNFNSRRMPNADDTLGYLDRLSRRVADSNRPIDMGAIIDARKQIVDAEKAAKKAASGPQGDGSDWAAMQRIKRGFDSFVEDAFNLGHFSGDAQQASALHRAALQGHAEYRNAFFQRNPGDAVGREMERIFGKMPDQALEPGTIIQNILGSPQTMGQKDLAPKMVRRLGEVLGTDSAEFSGLRQSAFRLLTEDPNGRTPGLVAKDIRRFLDGHKSRGTAEALFTPAQRHVLRRYADLMEQISPPQGTIQGSNNSIWAKGAKVIGGILAAGLFGASTGGASMGLLAAGAAGAYSGIKPFLEARKVARWMPTFAESFERWQRAQRNLNRINNGMNNKVAAVASANLAANLEKIGINPTTFFRELGASNPVGAEEENQENRPRN